MSSALNIHQDNGSRVRAAQSPRHRGVAATDNPTFGSDSASTATQPVLASATDATVAGGIDAVGPPRGRAIVTSRNAGVDCALIADAIEVLKGSFQDLAADSWSDNPPEEEDIVSQLIAEIQSAIPSGESASHGDRHGPAVVFTHTDIDEEHFFNSLPDDPDLSDTESDDSESTVQARHPDVANTAATPEVPAMWSENTLVPYLDVIQAGDYATAIRLYRLAHQQNPAGAAELNIRKLVRLLRSGFNLFSKREFWLTCDYILELDALHSDVEVRDARDDS
ncbi:hypothetical protein DXG01_008325 [Tephrocybe rancida]|nr:hypothetical protein DXG01_008325 [Tephrocybe rancida]